MAKKHLMAVVRGSQPRMAEMNFYSYFDDFNTRFLGDKHTGWVVEDAIPKNIKYIHLPLKPVWGFDPITTFLGPAHAHRSWKHVEGLENYLRDVDVINISDCFYFYCGQAAKLAKKLNKKLVVIVWQNVPRHLSTYLPPYSFNVKAVLEQADLFIARSKKSRDYLLSIGAEERKVKVIYKGINMSQFTPKERKRDGKIRILYVGQLVKSKGVGELLEAFERLSSEFGNLELWLLGRSKGEMMEEKIKRLAKHLPIVLKAQVDYDKLPEIYRGADIYCHLSQDWKYLGLVRGGNDWFPYATIEAMASGLPIVATKVGGIPEQLGRVGNIYVEQKDADSVYKGLKKMISDSALRQTVGRKNRARAEKMFEIKKLAHVTEKAILKIL